MIVLTLQNERDLLRLIEGLGRLEDDLYELADSAYNSDHRDDTDATVIEMDHVRGLRRRLMKVAS